MRAKWMPVLVLMSALAVFATACSDSSSDSSDGDSDDGGSSGASISGKWNGSFSTGVEFTLDLTQSDDAFVGSYATGDLETLGTVTGTINSNAVEMTITTDDAVTAQFAGSINDQRNAMGGAFTIVSGGGGNGTWSASK